MLWLDGVDCEGQSTSSNFPSLFTKCTYVAITKSPEYRVRWCNWDGGPIANEVFGVDVSSISGDVFTLNPFTRDWTVTNTFMLPGDHPDLWQSYGSGSNRILMDGYCSASVMQMIFMDNGLPDNLDLAMVNVVMLTSGGEVAHAGSAAEDVLLWNVELIGQPFLIKTSGTGQMVQLGVCGCILPSVTVCSGVNMSNWYWDNNQFTGTGAMGDNAVTSNPGFTTNYFPSNGISVPRTVRWDLFQQPRANPTIAGAFAADYPVPLIPAPPSGLTVTPAP